MPFLIPIILLLAVIAVLGLLLRSRAFKGALGELKVRKFLRSKLDPQDFRVLNDVTLRVSGGTTQIDHVVLSRYGIFVLETKHLSGWLFGRATDRFWTQSLGRRKVQMPNPLKQNEAHIRALEEVTHLPRDAFQPAVVMTGMASFKTSKPEGVLSLVELARWIASKPAMTLSRERLVQALEAIEAARLEPGKAADRAHLAAMGMTGAKAAVSSMIRTLAFSWLGTVALQGLAVFALGLIAVLVYLLVQDTVETLQSIVQPDIRPPSMEQSGTTQPPGNDTAMGSVSTIKNVTKQPERAVPAKPSTGTMPTNLRCAYSEDTDRCVCHDERALRVDVPHEACKRRASGRQ